MVDIVKSVTDVPVAVGFGISTPEQAAKIAAQSDGIIIGSAIMKLVEQYGKKAVPHVSEFVKSIKTSI